MYGLDWSWSEGTWLQRQLLLGHVDKWKCRQEAYGNGNRNRSENLAFLLLIDGIMIPLPQPDTCPVLGFFYT